MLHFTRISELAGMVRILETFRYFPQQIFLQFSLILKPPEVLVELECKALTKIWEFSFQTFSPALSYFHTIWTNNTF